MSEHRSTELDELADMLNDCGHGTVPNNTTQRYVIASQEGKVIGALITLNDLDRLEQLDKNAKDRERAGRRGNPWQQWEDDLMLDFDLEDLDIAIQTQRTLKSVRERKRWIRRIAEERGQG